MRLRKVKGALDKLSVDTKYYINEPFSFKGQWKKKVFNNDNPLHIEIGCGKGKFITEMSVKYPLINFIGIEKYDSVLLRADEKVNEFDLPNLKLILLDAMTIETAFANGEVDLIYLNFSDPWIKKRQYKRRLTAASFLDSYKNILQDDGAIYQKTDNRFLFAYSLESFANNGYYLSNVSLDLHHDEWEDNITTEFEEKWSKLGPIYRLEARKKRCE